MFHSNDQGVLSKALQDLRLLLSDYKGTCIPQVIQDDAIEIIMRLSAECVNIEIRIQATWCLSNLCFGNTEDIC